VSSRNKKFKQHQNDLVHNHHHDDNLTKGLQHRDDASKKLDQTLKDHFANPQSKHGSKK